jgi:hypothetical protein
MWTCVSEEIPIKKMVYMGKGVTHYFGHFGDVSRSICSGSQKDLSYEKSD